MELITLRALLQNFVGDPNESWGQPTDGWGNPADINVGKVAHVPVEQADRNTARLNSGTYTPEQLEDFDHQLAEVERGSRGTAYFAGDPDNLPDSVPLRACSKCSDTFRSALDRRGVNCYKCEIDRLCPDLPGSHIDCRWQRDDWSLQAHGDIGFHNELTFWWSNRNSGGNASHQGLMLKRNADGDILWMTLKTVSYGERKRYSIRFDLVDQTKPMSFLVSTSTSLSEEQDIYHKESEVQEPFSGLVLDYIVAMMPSWMVYEYRPRDPANGCFSLA